MITPYVDEVEELRLFDILIHLSSCPSIENVPFEDITLLGLYQKEWSFDKGRRVSRNYLLGSSTGETVVQTRYEYEFEGATNFVNCFKFIIDYYDYNGNVGLSKEIEKVITGQKLENFNKIIRQNQVAYLRASGKELRQDAEYVVDPVQKAQLIGAADLIDAMWIRWKDDIIEYENTGNDSLENTIINETVEPFNSVLNTIDPEYNFTMRAIILNQIT